MSLNTWIQINKMFVIKFCPVSKLQKSSEFPLFKKTNKQTICCFKLMTSHTYLINSVKQYFFSISEKLF